jgi:hypothetical protein
LYFCLSCSNWSGMGYSFDYLIDEVNAPRFGAACGSLVGLERYTLRAVQCNWGTSGGVVVLRRILHDLKAVTG